jgi:hypothetical protein
MNGLIGVASWWRNKIHAKVVEALRAEGRCPSCGQPPAHWVVSTEVAWCATKDCAVLTFRPINQARRSAASVQAVA